MKIALVIYNYSETKGGVERRVVNLARGLVEQGHEVHIFCHNLLVIPGGEKSPDSKIKFHIVPTTLGFYTPFRVLSFAANSARMLRQQDFDIIHGFGRTCYQDVYHCGSGLHREYLRRTHNSMKTLPGRIIQAINPRNRAIIYLEKKLFESSAYKKIIFVSKWVKDEIQGYYPETKQRDEDTEVIYNPVDTNKFRVENKTRYRETVRNELGIDKNDLVVLLVGTGFHLKGLKYAIAGIGLLPKEMAVRLLVIGRGSIRKYQRQAKRLDIQNRVLFLGPRNDVERYYAAGDIFLLPSLHETFGIVCLEAAASGLPVIVSQNAGVAEILTNAVDSFLLDDPRNADQIARKISFLSDKTWRENMGKAACATALKYSFKYHLGKVLKVYYNVLKMR